MGPVIAALLPTVTEIINKIIPDPKAAAEAKLKALELAQKGELAQLDADVRMAIGQMEINKADAQAGLGAFRAGWRPMIGYVGATALAFYYVVRPLVLWLSAIFGWNIVPPDVRLDESLWQLISLMLGMAGWRTYDKTKGKG
jgi:hypothetical protein